MFDIDTQETGSDLQPTSNHAPRVFAVLVPGMNLPDMTILPLVPAGGWVGQMANRLFSQIFSTGQRVVPFSAPSAFVARYQAGGSDEDAVRQFLSVEKLERLSRFENLILKTGGDTAMVFRPPVPQSQPLVTWANDAQAVLKSLIA